MDKQAIIRNFSKYASAYDQYAGVQRLTGEHLLQRTEEDGFKNILEIGCGTGNYTLLLRKKFTNARLRAIDISEKMIEIASQKLKDKNIEFNLWDAEKITLDEKFDLVTSNACFQWFGDLEGAIKKYRDKLVPKGIISFSIFGHLTFKELGLALKCVLGKNYIESNGFVSFKNIGRILRSNFSNVEVFEKEYEERFSDLAGLLRKIKYTGVRGKGFNGKVVFMPDLMKKIEEAYLDKFKHIKATYQVFFCQGMNL